MDYEKLILFIYSAYLIIMSIITFILYFVDKKKAINGSIRIKEKTLLSFTALGGGLGALLGSIIARHKINKIYFTIIIILSVALEALSLTFIGMVALGR